jgi:uncharacterized protein (TIGR03067 family)
MRMTPTFLALALAVAAPAPKADAKEAASIVGEWAADGYVQAGSQRDRPIRITFTADGKFLVQEGKREKPEEATYKADPKKAPAEIDIFPPVRQTAPPMMGIYKVDGDTLTLCVSKGGPEAGTRPAKFESAEGSRDTLFTLKRVKAKD